MTAFMNPNDIRSLYETACVDPDTRMPWSNLELLGMRSKKMLEVPMSKAMDASKSGIDPYRPDIEDRMAKALAGQDTLGTGYQGTETYQPQNRNADIVKQFDSRQSSIFHYLMNVFKPRDTRTIAFTVGRETDIGHDPWKSMAISESGVPGTSSFSIEESPPYRCKIHAQRVDRSVLIALANIATSYGLGDAGQHALELQRIVLPLAMARDMWLAKSACSRVAGVGSDYLLYDGLATQVINKWAATGYGSGSHSHIVVDMKGKAIRRSDVDLVLYNLSDPYKGALSILQQQLVPGGDMSKPNSVQNIVFLSGNRQFMKFKEEFAPRFVELNRKSSVGFAWNGQIETDHGIVVGNLEPRLDRGWLHIGDAFTLAATSGCSYVAPVRVTAEEVTQATGTSGRSWFSDHGTTGTYHYWVATAGADGHSAWTYVDAPATITADHVTKLTVDTTGGLAGVTKLEVLRGTSSSISSALYLGEFPVTAGVSTVIYDDDMIMAGMSQSMIIPGMSNDSNPAAQQAVLLPFTTVKMAMDGLTHRDALLYAGCPVVNNDKQVVLFINVGVA